jgi:hypothetical protein
LLIRWSLFDYHDWPEVAPFILSLTPNLKAATEKAGGGVMFWFTTLDVVNTGNVLNAPIWQVAGRDDNYALT